MARDRKFPTERPGEAAFNLDVVTIRPRQRIELPILARQAAPDAVPIRGEPLSEVWWRGAQWAVTSYGLERLDGSYAIEARDLLHQAESWGWPSQIAMKVWGEADDIATAFCVALVLHGHSKCPPHTVLTMCLYDNAQRS
jgi:hypothetical protein